jgi:heme oxygenase (biliverdin-IX-beta and delta-forming)
MKRELIDVLRALIRERKTAALGTLHQGKPFVSLCPFAITRDGCFIVHVSRLAAHTQHMISNADVSVLISESEHTEKMAQELGRVTIQGRARMLERGSTEAALARDAYLARFPDAAALFDFADFSIFKIEAVSARVIAGFGQAATIENEELAAAIGEIEAG